MLICVFEFRYNSAIFRSLSSNDYTIAVAKDSFIHNSSWSLSTAENNRNGDVSWNDSRVNPPELDYFTTIKGIQASAISNKYEELNVSACFDLYSDYWAPQGNAVILVANQSVQTPANDSLLMYVSVIPRSDNWAKNMWASANGTGRYVSTSPESPVTKWYLGPKQYKVSRCLVQPPENIEVRCRFEYCRPIMITICVLNSMKAMVIVFIWGLRRWQDRAQRDLDQDVLYTLGDAVASFMRRPEQRTRNMCLATKYDFESKRAWKNRLVKKRPELNTDPRPWKEDQKLFWMKSASRRRWFILVSTYVLMTSVTWSESQVSCWDQNVELKIEC